MAYIKNTDYQALIDDAVKRGDLNAAAQYERVRNEKIKGEGLDVGTTNNYSKYLNNNTFDNVYTWNSEQADMVDKAKQNALNWWGSDATGQKVLSDANKQIFANLGSGITHNDQTGTWSGVADKPISVETGVDIAMPTFDYDAWLEENPAPSFSYEDYLSNNPKPSFSYDDYLTNNPKPTYESQYSAKIDALLNQILNREEFSYNLETDPLYQQYKNQYQREGTRAMNDTLASAASGAGGMNTWAVTAAQQANDYYNAQLNDRVPELYRLAYEMYLQDVDGQVRDLGLLQQMDNTQYGRYQDDVNYWYNDLNFAYGQHRDNTSDWYNDYNNAYGEYRDQRGDWENDRNFVYTDYRDDMGDYRWGTEFNYNAELDEYNKQWNQKEWDYNTEQKALDRAESNQKDAYERAMDMLLMGVMPNSALLAKAGITDAEAKAIKAANTETILTDPTPKTDPEPKVDEPYTPPKTSDSDKPRDKDYSDDGKHAKDETYEKADDVELSVDMNSVLALGYGPISEDALNDLVASGDVIEYQEGNKIKFRKNDKKVFDGIKMFQLY